MDGEKISVVIPVYNVAAYLERCLSSVVGQTYENLEIICVDDGSTDRSGEILDHFAAEDDRIVVIHQPNGGVSTARNTALDRCTGDFIGFVDGDDWLESDMYETLIRNITAYDIDISACGYFEDYGGEARQVENMLPVPQHPMDTRDFLKYIYIRDQYRGVASYLCSRLMRRDVILKPAISFDRQITHCEDIIFAAQCYLRSRKSVYTSIPLYHYVQRQDSAHCDSQRILNGLGACVAYQRIIDLYEESGINQTVIDYVKRFYVYHTSKLLKLALACGDQNKTAVLKKNIQKYFDVYCRTNAEYPERMEEVRKLLEQ